MSLGASSLPPGAPVLPLYSADVTPAGGGGYVLRGMGSWVAPLLDSSVTPLSGAPGTELQTAHTRSAHPRSIRLRCGRPNYFDSLDGGGGGTTLFLTPAQHRADHPGADP